MSTASTNTSSDANTTSGPAPPGGLAIQSSAASVSQPVSQPNSQPDVAMTDAKAVDVKTVDVKTQNLSGPAPPSATVQMEGSGKRVMTCVSEVGALLKGLGRDDFMTMVSLKAPTKDGNRRPSADVVLTVDRSGSVDGVMHLIKLVLTFVVEKQMTCKDRLAIVSYANDCAIDLPLILMDDAGKKRALNAVAKLQAAGSTNMGLALYTADTILLNAPNPSEVQAMLVFTDGLANCGPAQSNDSLVRIITDPNYYPSLNGYAQVPQAPPTLSSYSRPPTPPPIQPLVGIVWEWSEKYNANSPVVWTAYDNATSHQLEDALMSNTPMLKLTDGFFAGKDDYFAILDQNMRQINIVTKFERIIRRTVDNTTTSYNALVAKTQQPKPQTSSSSFSSSSPSSVSSLINAFGSLIGVSSSNSASNNSAVATAIHHKAPVISSSPSATPTPASTPTTVAPSTTTAIHLKPPPLSSTSTLDTTAITAASAATTAATAASAVRSVYTFGFTEGHDGKGLKSIADAGHGTYAYIPNEGKIGEAFADCLGGLLSTVMQRIQIRVTTTDPSITIRKVLTHFPIQHEGKCSAVITIPDMQSEEPRDILVQLNLPPTKSSNGPSASASFVENLLRVELTYYDLLEGKEKKETGDCRVVRCGSTDGILKVTKPHYGIDVQRNRLRTADAIEKAMGMAGAAQYKEAKALLRTAIEEIKRSMSAKDAFCQSLITDLENSCKSVESSEAYNARGGSCGMASMSSAHQQQRSTPSTSTPAYTTSSRTEAIKSFSSFTSN